MSQYARRIDANQNEIVAALRACVHRKDQRSYWNGTALNENGKKVKISYGSTTEEAFKNMLNNEIH